MTTQVTGTLHETIAEIEELVRRVREQVGEHRRELVTAGWAGADLAALDRFVGGQPAGSSGLLGSRNQSRVAVALTRVGLRPAQVLAWLPVLAARSGRRVSPGEQAASLVSHYAAAAGGDQRVALLAVGAGLSPDELEAGLDSGAVTVAGLQMLAALRASA